MIKSNTIHIYKKFNYGLAILKFIMAFLVVKHHYFKTNSTKNKILLFLTKERYLHVPSFFIMSFYFTTSNFLSTNRKVILNRLEKLLIPYIGWSFIILIINHFFNKIFNKKLQDTLFDLKLQLLWGSRHIPQLWFQNALIVMTLVFYLIIFISRNHFLFIFQLLLIFSYISQYSKYIYKNIFLKYPQYNNKTISYFFVSIPYAVTGFTLGFYKIIEYFQKHKMKTFILSILIFISINEYQIFTNIKFIAYQGINLNIQCLCIIFIFSLFTSDNIKNKFLIKIITIFTNYTAGVFYLHIPIKRYFVYYFRSIKYGTIFGCIIIYLICYIICFFGMLIFGKSKIKYLFC